MSDRNSQTRRMEAIASTKRELELRGQTPEWIKKVSEFLNGIETPEISNILEGLRTEPQEYQSKLAEAIQGDIDDSTIASEAEPFMQSAAGTLDTTETAAAAYTAEEENRQYDSRRLREIVSTYQLDTRSPGDISPTQAADIAESAMSYAPDDAKVVINDLLTTIRGDRGARAQFARNELIAVLSRLGASE